MRFRARGSADKDVRVGTVSDNGAGVRVEHSLELRAGDSETSLSVPVAALEEVLCGVLGRAPAAVWICGERVAHHDRRGARGSAHELDRCEFAEDAGRAR